MVRQEERWLLSTDLKPSASPHGDRLILSGLRFWSRDEHQTTYPCCCRAVSASSKF